MYAWWSRASHAAVLAHSVWDLSTGRCLRVLRGHKTTITTLDYCAASGAAISGASDGTMRVWDVASGRKAYTMAMETGVSAACVRAGRVVAGSVGGQVQVYDSLSMAPVQRKSRGRDHLRKQFKAHHATVTDVDFDDFFIVTADNDKFAKLWSMAASQKSCLQQFRHSCAVHSARILSLRCVTGAADGKIRIWNFLDGNCIRIFRGNSYCHPVVGIDFVDRSRLCVNTTTSMHVLNFDSCDGDADADGVRLARLPCVGAHLLTLNPRLMKNAATDTSGAVEPIAAVVRGQMGAPRRPQTPARRPQSSLGERRAAAAAQAEHRADVVRQRMERFRKNRSRSSFSGGWRTTNDGRRRSQESPMPSPLHEAVGSNDAFLSSQSSR